MDLTIVKKPNRQNFRKRKSSSSEEEKSDDDLTVQQVRELRFLRDQRKRKHGIDIVAATPLSSDTGIQPDLSINDPLRLKSGGGLANMNALKQMASDVANTTTSSIGTAFAAETKRRDEDLELLRYVEEEMGKRRGEKSEEASTDQTPSQSTDPKAKLYELPDYLNVKTVQNKKEENTSSQMLNGIPEVDLGLDAKMKNIEETEAAKQKLWEEMRGSKEEVSQFVPTNYAVDFVQHNRWSNSNKVAPNIQIAFEQATVRKKAREAEWAAEAAARAAKVVVQISEPGSEGVKYIPPRPVEPPKKPRFKKPYKPYRKPRPDKK